MNKRVKHLRKILNLSQTEFADKLQITQAGLSKIEVGGSILTERNIKAICEKFNVNEDWLRNGTEPIFNNDYSNINTRLKELRKNILKLTLKQFGEKISLSSGALGDIENGRRTLQDRHIKLICQTFNVNENWLRNGIEPIFKEETNDALEEFFNKNNASDLAKTIIREYFSLDESKRKIFEDFLEQCILKVMKTDENNS